MGVNIYILDRRRVRLSVGGVEQDAGSLRRFWKITELDDERAAELTAGTASVSDIAAPRAAMLADVDEIPLGSATGRTVKAHLVIGWDEGRTSVTDMGWDYLPILGYAVRDPESGIFLLHEKRDGGLRQISRAHAIEIGLLNADGQPTLRGQPTISECLSVHPYIAGYAEADVTFSDGRRQKLLTLVADSILPDPSWFVGKKPMQVGQYLLSGPTVA
jgi:hypothetical protein